jgi:hypothetical protein
MKKFLKHLIAIIITSAFVFLPVSDDNPAYNTPIIITVLAIIGGVCSIFFILNTLFYFISLYYENKKN